MRKLYAVASLLALALCLFVMHTTQDSRPGYVAQAEQSDHSTVDVAAVAADAARMPAMASDTRKTNHYPLSTTNPTDSAGSAVEIASGDALAVPWCAVT